VFGAGAFGGWTALDLVRRGARVRLMDAWGPGNARASSGGETRVIRATYGSHAVYTRMSVRALELWRAYEDRWHQDLLRTTGALWMFGEDDRFGRASAQTLHANGIPLEELTSSEARRRYPQVNFDDVSSVLFEPDAGYLAAQRACTHVAERVVSEGGEYSQRAAAAPDGLTGSIVKRVALLDGSIIEADAFVFACGPWLGQLFPDVLGSLIAATRQEVYYFGTPAGDPRFQDSALPVWLDAGDRFIYGIPARGIGELKVADDTPGPGINPTTDERVPTSGGVAAIRAFLARRFPNLADAPLIRSEVCQYETSPDSNFIIDRHPHAPNVWIVGGGSGHGFKMGPVVGEKVASLVLGEGTVDPYFGLRRFAEVPPGGWPPKWS
jgi:sarcosine oxidase